MSLNNIFWSQTTLSVTDKLFQPELAAELATLSADGLLRRRRQLDAPCAPHTVVEGQPMLAFASNDYLGLAAHPALVEALVDGARRWGTGSGASHLVSGHLAPHEQLETALAAFTGFPATLTFSTGCLLYTSRCV